ncbi:MAG: sulfate adenylyltransferase subunit CysN [Acidobacteria bacterium]|nr:sulfate adenylyltransferase subunit CysN [Acidobacteriota bacterium]
MATATAQRPIEAIRFLRREGEKSLLRFSTAGSVDDGKSTLIGRLLFDTQGAFDDQIEAVRKSPVNRSTGAVDFSLLTDGLRAEREQGITIDVAYRYFATARRKFIIADTPGHEQYTRNMATGASNCDLAVILVDARKGVLEQSRRHAYISALLGIRRLVVAVNKMDLAGYDQEVFERIRADFQSLAGKLHGAHLDFIPVSALEGDNVVTPSRRMDWYTGPTLLEYLETVEAGERSADAPFRFPVQLVIRPDDGFRGYAGQIAAGRVRAGEAVVALPSGRATRIQSITTFDGELDEAFAPMSVTLTLEDEVDLGRGDLLAGAPHPPETGRHLLAMLVWMSAQPLKLDTGYLLRHGPHESTARVRGIARRVDVATLDAAEGRPLKLNEIGLAAIESARPLAFDPYRSNRRTGGFILVDPITNLTVAAGMIERRDIDPAGARTGRRAWYGHGPCLVRAAAPEPVLEALERRLFEKGAHVVRLSRAVEPVEALLETGLIVIAPAAGPAGGHPYLDPAEALPAAGSEAAAEALLEQLRRLGVWSVREQFNQGGGI